MTTPILSADEIIANRQQEAELALAEAINRAISYINEKLKNDFHPGSVIKVSVKEMQWAIGVTFSPTTLEIIKTAIIKSGWKVNSTHPIRSPHKISVFEISG